MNTLQLEKMTVKFGQRDRELAKRVKQGKMNRFAEPKQNKRSVRKATGKHLWLNMKDEP